MFFSISSIVRGPIGCRISSKTTWNSAATANGEGKNWDWDGVYVAVDESTALGYVVDKVTDGSGIAYLQQVSLINASVPIIDVAGKGFGTGDIDMKKVKAGMRSLGVDVKDDDLLMRKLGALGYLCRCPNNDLGDLEIIVPKALATMLSMECVKKITVEKYTVRKVEPFIQG